MKLTMVDFFREMFARQHASNPDSEAPPKHIPPEDQLLANTDSDIPTCIDILVEESVIKNNSKESLKVVSTMLAFEREHIYYLQSVNIETSQSFALGNSFRSRRHRRMLSLETLGTNSSGGAYEDLDEALHTTRGNTKRRTKHFSFSNFCISRNSSNSCRSSDSSDSDDCFDDEDEYLLRLQKELDDFEKARGDKLTESEREMLFMKHVTKHVMIRYAKKRQTSRSPKTMQVFCKKYGV